MKIPLGILLATHALISAEAFDPLAALTRSAAALSLTPTPAQAVHQEFTQALQERRCFKHALCIDPIIEPAALPTILQAFQSINTWTPETQSIVTNLLQYIHHMDEAEQSLFLGSLLLACLPDLPSTISQHTISAEIVPNNNAFRITISDCWTDPPTALIPLRALPENGFQAIRAMLAASETFAFLRLQTTLNQIPIETKLGTQKHSSGIVFRALLALAPPDTWQSDMFSSFFWNSLFKHCKNEPPLNDQALLLNFHQLFRTCAKEPY